MEDESAAAVEEVDAGEDLLERALADQAGVVGEVEDRDRQVLGARDGEVLGLQDGGEVADGSVGSVGSRRWRPTEQVAQQHRNQHDERGGRDDRDQV